MTRAALDIVLNDPDRYVMTDEERQQYERLAVFFGTAAVDPSRFPLSPKQASRLKSIVKKAKGSSQPQSRRNRRKVRQERRQGYHKQRRKDLREFKEQYNAAMAQLRKDAEEAEAAHAEAMARYENEPKFDVYDGVGNLIMAGVPKSAIVLQDVEGVETELPEKAKAAHVILPGTAEALGLDV